MILSEEQVKNLKEAVFGHGVVFESVAIKAIKDMFESLEFFRAENVRLRMALETYGSHAVGCSRTMSFHIQAGATFGKPEVSPCSCGFDSFLADPPPPNGEAKEERP